MRDPTQTFDPPNGFLFELEVSSLLALQRQLGGPSSGFQPSTMAHSSLVGAFVSGGAGGKGGGGGKGGAHAHAPALARQDQPPTERPQGGPAGPPAADPARFLEVARGGPDQR